MTQSFGRIEKDDYKPKHRKFNKKTDARWRVVYPDPKSLGLKKESFRSEELAKQRLSDLNQRPVSSLESDNWSVSNALDLWSEKRLLKLKSAQVEGYKLRLLKKHLGEVKLNKLKEEHIIRFKAYLAKGRKIRTVNAYLVTLRTALNYAKRKGFLQSFPDISEHVEASLEVKRERVATPEEFERLLQACYTKKSGRDRGHLMPYLLWLHETGMRTGELKKVKVKDIDIERGLVRIWSGKTKRPVQRECGLTPRLRNFIIESRVLERDREERIFNGQNRWQRSFATACRIAKIDDFRMHDLRRTAITNMLEKGIPLHLVAKMAGHSANSVLTLDVYTKFRSDFIQEMMAKMA